MRLLNNALQKICLNCGSKKLKTLFQVKKSKMVYNYLRCNNCTLIFIDPIIKLSEQFKLYDYESTIEHSNKKNFNIRILNKIAITSKLLRDYALFCFKQRKNKISNLISKGKLLDVGCGEGDFLNMFDKKNWKIMGVEINPNLAREAKLKTKAQIYTQPIQKLNLKGSIDIVTMWHVFEHIDTPKDVLGKVYKILNKGGFLVIEVPNGDGIYRKFFGKYWQLLITPEHLFFWTKKSLTSVLKKEGFVIKEISSEGIINFSGPSSLSYFFLKNGLNPYLSLILAIVFFPISIILNLIFFNIRDNLLVIAKKK